MAEGAAIGGGGLGRGTVGGHVGGSGELVRAAALKKNSLPLAICSYPLRRFVPPPSCKLPPFLSVLPRVFFLSLPRLLLRLSIISH